MFMGVFLACIFVPWDDKGQKRELADPPIPDLELQTIVNCHLDAGN